MLESRKLYQAAQHKNQCQTFSKSFHESSSHFSFRTPPKL
ncbi:hypothetical protein CU025_0389 [Enterococcus faecium]|nr:hypothetical protein [Enterococcus faecium]MBK4810826.1 hypothetical protein [Enterococcus faecium]MBK4821730.1 hypothetical protein [Enterococcus faecium]